MVEFICDNLLLLLFFCSGCLCLILFIFFGFYTYLKGGEYE